LSLINRVLVGQAGPIAKTFPPLEKAAIDGNAWGHILNPFLAMLAVACMLKTGTDNFCARKR
jgi:hypothetical protein